MNPPNEEFSRPPIAEVGLRIHPSELGLGADVVDLESFQSNANGLLLTPRVDLRTLIDEMPHGDNASTLVGKADSGKSEIMRRASSLLGVPNIDDGLLFRALANQATIQGYQGGNVAPEMSDSLLGTIETMSLILGSPKDDVEQAIEINGVRYVYGSLDNVDRNIVSGISQDSRLYTATMDRLVQATEGKLVIVGGRSINQHLPDAIAKFYIKRNGGNDVNESGPTWSLDKPSSSDMITVDNPEGEVEGCARAVSLVLARRVEARVSGDSKYPLSLRGVTFVTGEQAKVREVGAAITNADHIVDNEISNPVNVAPNFLHELTSVVEAKARNARAKFPDDMALMVESTALFVPKLHEMGLPPEVIDYMSKHNYTAIFDYAGTDSLDAYSVTVAAIADRSGSLVTSLGVASGSLRAQAEGEQGFGWDTYFTPTGHDRTYGAMGDDKFKISSRALSIAKLVKELH